MEDRGMYADYNAWAVSEASLAALVDHPSFPLAEDDHGNTLLHYAALMNSPVLARRLLKAGADLYTINR